MREENEDRADNVIDVKFIADAEQETVRQRRSGRPTREIRTELVHLDFFRGAGVSCAAPSGIPQRCRLLHP
jgi:hypothetical protein